MDSLADKYDKDLMLEIALVNIAINGIAKARCTDLHGASKMAKDALRASLENLENVAKARILELSDS